jgi:tetratricopeptide (TPR) repeat protein
MDKKQKRKMFHPHKSLFCANILQFVVFSKPPKIVVRMILLAFYLFAILVCHQTALSDNSDLSIRNLKVGLESDPTNVTKLRDLGLLYYLQDDNVSAQKYLGLAIELSKYTDKISVWNYVNALYFDNKGEEALAFIEEFYHTHSKDIDTILLAGRMNLCNGHTAIAQQRFEEALAIYSDGEVVYHQILVFYEEAMAYSEAEGFLRKCLQLFPHSSNIRFQAAVLLFNLGYVGEALLLFEEVLRQDAARQVEASLMVGAAHQALGNTDSAKSFYKRIYEDQALGPASPSYVSFLSNYGLLLKNSKDKAEVEMGVMLIHQALEINPNFENALINLAMHYRALDDIDTSVVYLTRAAEVSSNSRQLKIDIAANSMDEVMFSWDRVLLQRRGMVRSLTQLLAEGPPLAQHFHEYNILNLHFNIQYHSFNDRHLQELMYRVYEMNIKHFSHISPRLLLDSPLPPSSSSISTPATESISDRRIKIGFISKSFGVFEPHGLLLDGVVRYLPRDRFQVFVLRIALEKEAAGHMTSPTLVDYADVLVDIPQTHSFAAEIVERLELDILVFADVLCEPVNHFLMFSRYAKIQILFWWVLLLVVDIYILLSIVIIIVHSAVHALNVLFLSPHTTHMLVLSCLVLSCLVGVIRSHRGPLRWTTSCPASTWSTRFAPA